MSIDQLLLLLSAVALGIVAWQITRRHRTFRREMGAALGAVSDSEAALLRRAGIVDRQLAELRSQSDRLRSVLDSTAIGVVIVDDRGKEIFANPAATAFTTGRGGDAVVGIRIKELLQLVAETGSAQEQEVEIFTPSQRTIGLQAMPLVQGDDDLGIAVFAEDHTPRSLIDAIRRDFVANASHELKTPLGALRLLSEALLATTDPEARESLSERIQAEATRMTRLVEDILDLSLIEAHQTVRGVVNLCDVVEEAINQVNLASETLDVPVERDCVSVEVLGDHRRLVSAVANLLENAVAYTRARGEESVQPVVVRAFRTGDQAYIEVEDQGIGIAERHLGRIFERFYRIDKGRSRTSGGTGLGLAIVRHVVQNHWGEVTVDSVPGKGSTFRIVLPAREN